MALILNIETATTVCSAAVSRGDQTIALRELDEGYTHAENLHVFIKQVLDESGCSPKDLDAIAVSSGPGSYTGLRIGASTAKGLAFSLQKPLIAVSTLQLMSLSAAHQVKAKYFAPMIDARRMEVYTSVFSETFEPIRETEALIIDAESINRFRDYKGIAFFGDGMPKCKALLESIPGSVFIDQVKPSAKFMGALSNARYERHEFEDIAIFEPFYLKDYLIKEKKKGPVSKGDG